MKREWLAAACAVIGADVAGANPFRFVSLPDTQIYSENIFPGTPNRPPVTDPLGTGRIFGAQTQWIVDNAAAMNIGYVGHLGDIIQNGEVVGVAEQEWARAKAAMNKLLDADIPHGTAMGNHDDQQHGAAYNAAYLENFGPQVFAGRSWYAGSSPGGGGNFQRVQHNGRKIGFLNLSIDQPTSEIDWANQILAANRDTLFVVGTHRYMYDYKLFAGRYGQVNVTPLGTFTIVEDIIPPDGNLGQVLFQRVIANNPNVMMIHAGHFHSEYFQLTNRPGMEQVLEMLTDYQDARNGGDGWMRLYSMDFDTNTFSWETVSPTAEVSAGNGLTRIGGARSVLHHFVETIQQAFTQRAQVKQILGIPTDEAYFAFLNANLKDNPLVPDGFLTLHPDWDAQYFSDYLADMFDVPNGGLIPAGFGNILEWENLWLAGFAANPLNPLDFSDGPRSPKGSIQVNFNGFIPEPGSAAALVGAALIAGGRRRRS